VQFVQVVIILSSQHSKWRHKSDYRIKIRKRK
jgi:hypothetical protein